ncbi:MAG: helix-hairpin-helix domain-containing protein [Bacteroidota bacterium]
MKRFIKAYTSFTRTEKLGIIVLLSVLLLLIAFRYTMQWWVQPQIDTRQEQQLSASWGKYKQEQYLHSTDSTSEDESHFNQESPNIATSSLIDLNAADSITLIDLKGIGPKIAHRILDYRRNRGKFTDIGQLREIYHFPSSTLAYLQTRLTIHK